MSRIPRPTAGYAYVVAGVEGEDRKMHAKEKMKAVNVYGDQMVATIDGKGIDVASQRADDLDMMAVDHAKSGQNGHVFAIDIGCGHGGQAARLANAGASVVAMDLHDYRAEIAATLAREGIPSGRCFFLRADVGSEPDIGPFDIVMCQRMIHYLEYDKALKALVWFNRISAPGGKLFLSASGLDSELGNGYSDREVAVEQRFSRLSDDMAQKHSILSPVCLYRPDELSDLVTKAGWTVQKVFVSQFGNVKLFAVNKS
jgi:SAM-dependent methyltransferase